MLQKKLFIINFGLLVLVLLLGCFIMHSPKTSAANAVDWRAGQIIDDTIFTNKDAMSVAEIQAFLNQKIGTGGYDSVPGQCDTFGNRKATPYSSALSRYNYAVSIGKPARWTCLNNYYEVPKLTPGPGIPANNYGSDTIPPGAKSAAQLIWDAAQKYNISPKVLLVTIQKESAGPLTTDDWPWQSQYTYAMGAHCPDTAPCDADYAGFSIQISESAALFRWYLDSMNQPWWQYKKLGNNTILYNPDTGCGSSAVNIETKATAALYTYTPYQPNQAALNNLYSSGNACSAYGNRNFWRIYTDWFGSPRVTVPYAWSHESNGAWSDSARTKPFTTNITIAPGESAYVRVRARNMGNQTWRKINFHLGTLAPMDRQSPFYDSGAWLAPERPAELVESTVAPGDTGTFLFSLKAPSTPGTYYERFGVLVEGQQWLDDLGVHFVVNVTPARTAYPYARSTLLKGDMLRKGQYLMSPDTQTVLAFLGDGNLMIFQNFRAVWDSQTSGRPTTKFTFQTDGNLVLSDDSGRVWWQSNTAGSGATKLILQTDGNMTLYDQNMAAPWETFTAHNKNLLSFANPSIGIARMYPGQQIETTDRRYKLLLQEDGNLVLYSPNRYLWSSGTVGKPVSNLSILSDGNMVLHDNEGRVFWQSKTSGNGPSRLIMQDDGNLVLYSSNRATWYTATNGQK